MVEWSVGGEWWWWGCGGRGLGEKRKEYMASRNHARRAAASGGAALQPRSFEPSFLPCTRPNFDSFSFSNLGLRIFITCDLCDLCQQRRMFVDLYVSESVRIYYCSCFGMIICAVQHRHKDCNVCKDNFKYHARTHQISGRKT